MIWIKIDLITDIAVRKLINIAFFWSLEMFHFEEFVLSLCRCMEKRHVKYYLSVIFFLAEYEKLEVSSPRCFLHPISSVPLRALRWAGVWNMIRYAVSPILHRDIVGM